MNIIKQNRQNWIAKAGAILVAIHMAGSALAGVSPSSGPVGGGTIVTITGSNIGSGSDITNVTICGVTVCVISSQSATQVVVKASSSPGPLASGPVRVYSTSCGISVLSNAYSYVVDPGSMGVGLMAYYPFNGNANDASGKGNHAATNTASLAVDRFGQASSAYLFNSNAFMEMTSGLPDMTNMTISLWVNAEQLSDTSMMWEGDVWPAQDIALGIKTNDIRFATKSSDGFLVWTSPGLSTGQWYHLAVIGNSDTGQKQIWLNGSMVASANRTGPFGIGHHYRLQVGRVYDGSNPPSGYFQGLIDDIRVYNRALSALEVTSLFETYTGQVQTVTLSVTNGPAMGGNTVVITGSWLGNGSDITNVTVCGVVAAIQSQTSNSVTVIVGAGGVGPGNIVVKSSSRGVTTFAGAYTYNPQGYISSDGLSWASVSNLPVARGMMGAAAAGGRIYAMGGYYSGWNSAAYSYDPALPSQGWTSVTSLPVGLGCLTAESVGGKVYSLGGHGNSGYHADVYVYDPQQPGLGWLSVSNLPVAVSRLASAVVNEKIYVLGGSSSLGSQSAVYEYDPQLPGQGWRKINNMPQALENLSAIGSGGKLYAFGGSNPGGFQSTAYMCDPNHPELGWVSITNLPAARYAMAAADVNGRIFAIGGYNASQAGVNTVYMYDPGKPAQGWVSVSSLPTVKGEAPAVVANGKIYVISGASGPLTYQSTVFEGAFTAGVTPSSGPKVGGTTVTINGSNLGNGTDITNVTLCGVAAEIVSQSATQVVVITGSSPVPVSSGEVCVYSTSYGMSSRQNVFSYMGIYYTITASAGLNGTVSPSGVVSVVEGSGTNFIVQANPGRHIAGVLVDGIPVGAFGPESNIFEYAFADVGTNHILSATFNTPPVIGVSASPTNGVLPARVLFDFATSADAEANIVRYEVDKDGDGTYEAASEGISRVTVEYDLPGVYQASARIVDACGAASSTTLVVSAHWNNPPVAGSLSVTTACNTARAIPLTAQDADGDPLSFVVMIPPSHGVLSGTGSSLTYIPALDYIGGDVFTYLVNDGRTNSLEAVVSLKINTAPQKMRISLVGYSKGEALTNFPVLVMLDPGAMTNGFSYQSFASPDGYDLRFLGADGVTFLNYDVEKWDTNGASMVWVQVPVLKSNSCVWACWGDETMSSAPPAYATNGAVWSQGYKGVWHLVESGGNALDSTTNRNVGTAIMGINRVMGKVAGGAAFDGTNGEFAVNSSFGLGKTSVTLETLAYVETNRNGAFLKIGDNSSGYGLGIGGSYFHTSGQNFLMLYEGIRWIQPGLKVGTGWHHFAMVISSAGIPSGYLDGVCIGAFSGSNANAPIGSITHIGGYLNTNGGSDQRHFKGMLDEVRISAVPRSTNWLWASWVNVASNSQFCKPDGIIVLDKDAYGIPYTWNIQNFGGTNAANGGALDDWDGDGMDNQSEYLAGTCPTNPGSRLAFMSGGSPWNVATNGPVITWASAAGKYYTLFRSTNLMSGFNHDVKTGIRATPPFNTEVDSSATGFGPWFYKVRVEP